MTDRELDAAVSEVLFGAGTYNYQALGRTERNYVLRPAGPGTAWSKLPHYSSTWEGLGLVIEAMRELGFECDLITWAGGANSAKFGCPWDVPSSSQGMETAATAPRAVAMAALGARGVGVA